MLIFNNIVKNYEEPVLGPINLKIKNNSFVSIIGPSGSGKSTILRLASGLIKESSGLISYEDCVKPKMGFVFGVCGIGVGICGDWGGVGIGEFPI